MTRLTEEMVVARAKQSDLSSIKKLNCWGSDLSDVSIIKRMCGVEVLALSVNKISTLQPFEDCIKLQELYLRKNNIQDIGEIAYLQHLPALKYLWLEENPCCEKAGANYRAIVLRALPNLKKLDNVDVTQEEIDDALRSPAGSGFSNGGSGRTSRNEGDVYQVPYETQNNQQPHEYHNQDEQQHQQYDPQPQHSQYQVHNNNHHHHQQQQPQQQPSQQFQRPQQQSHPQYYSQHPSPQKEQRSPGSPEQESSHALYRERPIPPSISTQSMKECYQSDRPACPSYYRHSQNDLTDWEEHPQYNQYGSNAALHHSARRSAGGGEVSERFSSRNGSARESGDWDEMERPKPRRPAEPRFNDAASVGPPQLYNHYNSVHRRPINRSSNLLSATLCLVKELDYPSLEVVEHAVRCRIDEMSAQ